MAPCKTKKVYREGVLYGVRVSIPTSSTVLSNPLGHYLYCRSCSPSSVYDNTYCSKCGRCEISTCEDCGIKTCCNWSCKKMVRPIDPSKPHCTCNEGKD